MKDIEQIDDLTGTWQGDDGSVTYMRQVKMKSSTQIFWASTGVFSPVFSNIFIGVRLGPNIVGQWVDVPQTFQKNIGVLSLEIVDCKTIRQISASQNYDTRIWTKIRSGFPPELDDDDCESR
jgi:hypothetical protein